MSQLLALLFFAATPPVDRESAIRAARDKYDAMLFSAAKAQLEDDIKGRKNGLARVKKAVIDPAVPGPTLFEGGLQFPDAASKQRAVSEALEAIAKAEADLELWKNGALKVSPTLPHLEFSKLIVGQVGPLGSVELVSIFDRGDSLVRMISSRTGRPEITPVVIVGLKRGGIFWVSGKRDIGKQSVFVIEPLFAD